MHEHQQNTTDLWWGILQDMLRQAEEEDREDAEFAAAAAAGEAKE